MATKRNLLCETMQHRPHVQSINHKLTAAAIWLVCGCAVPMPPRVVATQPTPALGDSIVVIGDTQRTMRGELLFGREQNEGERRALIDKLSAEERPAWIVHLGDMVALGDSGEAWTYFDRLMSPLTGRGIPMLPVMGNHEYWGDRTEALRMIHKRFAMLRERTYYARQHHELGLIWLDSNLSGDRRRAQNEWFDATLRAFDRDASVKGVIVFTHHPAFTNGRHRDDDAYVSGHVLRRFVASPKTLALMSGHIHGYEHFIHAERHLIVTGGGGGPRVEYHIDSSAPHTPAFQTATDDERPLNYVVIDRVDGGLVLTTKCVRCEGGILERIPIAYSNRPIP